MTDYISSCVRPDDAAAQRFIPEMAQRMTTPRIVVVGGGGASARGVLVDRINTFIRPRLKLH